MLFFLFLFLSHLAGFGCSCFLFGLEFFYAAECIDKFHFTGKERMAFTADVHMDFRFCCTDRKGMPAGAGYFRVTKPLWMNTRFHKKSYYIIGAAYCLANEREFALLEAGSVLLFPDIRNAHIQKEQGDINDERKIQHLLSP